MIMGPDSRVTVCAAIVNYYHAKVLQLIRGHVLCSSEWQSFSLVDAGICNQSCASTILKLGLTTVTAPVQCSALVPQSLSI